MYNSLGFLTAPLEVLTENIYNILWWSSHEQFHLLNKAHVLVLRCEHLVFVQLVATV